MGALKSTVSITARTRSHVAIRVLSTTVQSPPLNTTLTCEPELGFLDLPQKEGSRKEKKGILKISQREAQSHKNFNIKYRSNLMFLAMLMKYICYFKGNDEIPCLRDLTLHNNSDLTLHNNSEVNFTMPNLKKKKLKLGRLNNVPKLPIPGNVPANLIASSFMNAELQWKQAHFWSCP